MEQLTNNLILAAILLFGVLVFLTFYQFRLKRSHINKNTFNQYREIQLDIDGINIRIIQLMAEIERLEKRVKQLEDANR